MTRAWALAAVLLAAGCATFGAGSSSPPANALLGKVELPPVGRKWVVKETSYNEGTGQASTETVTWTLARETAHGGRPVYHVTDGRSVQVVDRGTLGVVAVLDAGSRETLVNEPHDAFISSPLWVGKQWVARSARFATSAPAALAVREALQHDDPAVRVAAIDATVALVSPRAEVVSALTPLVNDPDAAVRAHAQRALSGLR